MPAPCCPSRETLLQYSIGMLSNEQSDDLAGHLESCPDCQATITTLEDAEDTLIGRLRTPPGSESCLADPQFQAALAEVIAGKGVRSHLPERPDQPSVGARCFAQMAPDPFSPFSLGEYQVLEELGRGGMGRVYKALHTKLDRVVAVKVLPRGRLEDRHAITRFEREMKAVGRLAHPNIVQAHDAREIDGTPVLIMEFVDGLDLAEIVHRVGPLPVAEACELVRRTALALECAHEHGLVHRDIKPSNIMLTRSGEVKLLDLGLARFYAEATSGEEMTGTGQAMGTADYMAPEQASDSRTVDIRADIYSLGCTLYKLLSGQAPFGGPEYHGTLDKLNAHVHQPAPPISQFVADVPEELSAVLDRLLAKDPADRFPTPAEVAKIIEPLCTGANLIDVITRAISENHKVATVGRALVPSGQPAGTIQTETHPDPLPAPAWRRWIPILVALMLASMAAGFALGIIIRIYKDDQETTIEVPPGSTNRVGPDGRLDVKLSNQAKDEEVTKGKEANVTSGKIRFKIHYQPWKEVLPWFADQAGLSLMMDAPPPGTFNYSADKGYTVDEAIDLLNWVLMTKGYKLVRHERMLMLVTVAVERAIEPFEFDFKTAKVTRGDITAMVSATGTIEPAEVVDVSAQVSGRIVSFGDDPRGATDPQYKGKTIDYNSSVEEGTVLARIDAEIYKLRVDQEEANYKRTEFTYTLTERREKMGTASLDELGAAEAAFEKSKVALKEAKINLENTIIKSPIKGDIIARRVNIGQNVGPDPNAPSLFLIAKDLKKMEIWASVDEADIGRIREGMTASFTVDAFPNEVFKGKVIQIRKDAQLQQNSVLYTVVLNFDNSDLKLMPYMTANLKFEIDTRHDVLRAPNAALRWKPSSELVAEGGPVQVEKLEGLDVIIVRGDQDAVQNTISALNNLSTALANQNRGIIWVKSQDGKRVRPIEVKTGLTDGTITEISGPDLKEGMEVVIGQSLKVGIDHGPTINPFSPEDSKQSKKK